MQLVGSLAQKQHQHPCFCAHKWNWLAQRRQQHRALDARYAIPQHSSSCYGIHTPQMVNLKPRVLCMHAGCELAGTVQAQAADKAAAGEAHSGVPVQAVC